MEYVEDFRAEVKLPSGVLSYIDTKPDGDSVSTALFVHGVGVNTNLWSKVIQKIDSDVRCIAVDLPLHGLSPGHVGQDYSLSGFASMFESFCEALSLNGIDLVGNDSGGAISQVLATRNPSSFRSLTLTNCDVHTNLPPDSFKPTVALAAQGALWSKVKPLMDRPELLSQFSEVAKGFEEPAAVSVHAYLNFLEPIFGSQERCREFERMLLSLRAEDLVAIEPKLCALDLPVSLIWGTDDVFFPMKWLRWLEQRLPNIQKITELAGGKLYAPYERPTEVSQLLLEFWRSLT